MSVQTFSSFSGGAVNVHIADKLLKIAAKQVIFQQLGEKAKMPAGEGKTFQYNRYNRLNLPLNTLTEGTPPSSTDMSLSTVQAVADQWGAYIAISDVAQLTIKHPLLQVAMNLLGYQAAELVDREIINMLLGGTAVSFGGTAANRNALATASTDSLTDSVVQKMVAHLRNRGAYAYEGTHYVGVIDPSMEQDVSQAANSAFVSASAYSNVKQLYNGEIGMWRGVRWMVSNLIPTVLGAAAPSFSTPTGGTFAAADYRVYVAYIDNTTGFVTKISDVATAVTFASLDKLTFTTPATAGFTYKIFIGLAAGAVSGPFYQASETVALFASIAPSTAVEVLAPPTSGTVGQVPPAVAKTVHLGWVFGKESYAVVDLMNLKSYVSKPDATISDPLVQQRTVGWKLMFKSVIQNDNFMERVEVLSQFE